MDLGLCGRRALVTGASHGIGRAVAIGLAREGCQVSVVARRQVELQQVVDEMGGRIAGHDYVAQDMMEFGAPRSVVHTLVDRHGPIDIVAHSIGGTLGLKNILSPSEDWARVWHVNVGIAMDVNNEVLPHMQRQRWGRIIHISSISAQLVRSSPLYAMAKAALNTYTVVLGRAMAKNGVVVSAIMPGAIRVPGNHWDQALQARPDDVDDFLRHHQLIGRLGTPDEIAAFAVFLASQRASFATACVIPVHGGTVA